MALTLSQYIKSRGLRSALVAKQMGVRKQSLTNYGKAFTPTVKTLTKIATAMTELGAPTTVKDLVPLFDKYGEV